MNNEEMKKEIDKVFSKSRADIVDLAITIAEDDATLARFIGKKASRLDTMRHDVLSELENAES